MNETQFEYKFDSKEPWQKKHKMSLRGRFEKFLMHESNEPMTNEMFKEHVYNYIENHSTGINS